jgi:hypothetical protein
MTAESNAWITNRWGFRNSFRNMPDPAAAEGRSRVIAVD